MPKITFEPDGRTVEVRAGTTVLEASGRARVHIRTRCNGLASCLMCKVSVPDGQSAALRAPTPAEIRKIGSLLKEGTRLSCQARIQGDVTVDIPEDPLKAAIRKKLEEQQKERDELW